MWRSRFFSTTSPSLTHSILQTFHTHNSPAFHRLSSTSLNPVSRLMDTVDEKILEQHRVSKVQPFARLECKQAFDALSSKEKLYVHYLSKACWAGSPIVFEQVSPESPILRELFNILFTNESKSVSQLKEIVLKTKADVISEKTLNDFLLYAACFYGNHGNYLSFGDSKFIPRLSKEQFTVIVDAFKGAQQFNSESSAKIDSLLSSVINRVYSLSPKEAMLNFPESGISSYYSSNITKDDIKVSQKLMEELGISPYNTRLFKLNDNTLEIKIAAGSPTASSSTYNVNSRTIHVTYGDYGNHLSQVANLINQSIPFCSNAHQEAMLKAYVSHFHLGPIDHHKDAQRYWIKDVGPVVESNIGKTILSYIAIIDYLSRIY